MPFNARTHQLLLTIVIALVSITTAACIEDVDLGSWQPDALTDTSDAAVLTHQASTHHTIEGGDWDNIQSGRCSDAEQCPGPFSCVDGHCVPCVEEGLCPFGGGICDPEQNRCVEVEDCAGDNQLCRGPNRICLAGADAAFRCVECVYDSHCPRGRTCQWDPDGLTSTCVCDPTTSECAEAPCVDTDMFAQLQEGIDAAPLFSGYYESLSVCPFAQDGYTFDVSEGEAVRIHIWEHTQEMPVTAMLRGPSVGGRSAFQPVGKTDDGQLILTFERFPTRLIHDGGFAVLQVLPTSEQGPAQYDLSLEVLPKGTDLDDEHLDFAGAPIILQ